MTDFLKIAKSIAVHFAHICAYGVETVKQEVPRWKIQLMRRLSMRSKEEILCICFLVSMFIAISIMCN